MEYLDIKSMLSASLRSSSVGLSLEDVILVIARTSKMAYAALASTVSADDTISILQEEEQLAIILRLNRCRRPSFKLNPHTLYLNPSAQAQGTAQARALGTGKASSKKAPERQRGSFFVSSKKNNVQQ